MNVYDFDNTIYNGESAIDFFIYYCKKDKSLLKYVPSIIKALIDYKLGKITIEKALSKYGKLVSDYCVKNPNIFDEFYRFWNLYMNRIKLFYKDLQKDDDLIISGSLENSLEIVCKRLGIKHYIGSTIESDGTISRLCFRENKVKAFFEKYPNTRIDNFYTDSINDTPLIEISENAFLVKGNKIKRIK